MRGRGALAPLQPGVREPRDQAAVDEPGGRAPVHDGQLRAQAQGSETSTAWEVPAMGLRTPGTSRRGRAWHRAERVARRASPQTRGRWRTPTARRRRPRGESATAAAQRSSRGETGRRVARTAPRRREIARWGTGCRARSPTGAWPTTRRDCAARAEATHDPRHDVPPREARKPVGPEGFEPPTSTV